MHARSPAMPPEQKLPNPEGVMWGQLLHPLPNRKSLLPEYLF